MSWSRRRGSLAWMISAPTLFLLIFLLLLHGNDASLDFVEAGSKDRDYHGKRYSSRRSNTASRVSTYYYPPANPALGTPASMVYCVPSSTSSTASEKTEDGAKTTTAPSHGTEHSSHQPPPFFLVPSSLFSHGESQLDDPLYGAPLTGYREETLRAHGALTLTCFLPLTASSNSSPHSSSFSSSLHRSAEPSHLTLLLGPHVPSLQSPLSDPLAFYFRNFTYSYQLLHRPRGSEGDGGLFTAAVEDEEEEEVGVEGEEGGAAESGRTSRKIRAMFFYRNRSSRTSATASYTPSVLYSFDRIRYAMVGGRDDETPTRVAREEHLYGIPSGRSRVTPVFSSHTDGDDDERRSARSRRRRQPPPPRQGKGRRHAIEPHPPYMAQSIFLRLWYWGYECFFQRILRDGVGQYSWFSSSPFFVTSIVDALKPVKVSLAAGSWRRFWQQRSVEVRFTVREWMLPPETSYLDRDSYEGETGDGDRARDPFAPPPPRRSSRLMPLPSDILREGRDETLHILSFPPVAQRRRRTVGGQQQQEEGTAESTQQQQRTRSWRTRLPWPFHRGTVVETQPPMMREEEEELVCDYGAIKDARHHFLHDPIVFMSQTTAASSRSNERGYSSGSGERVAEDGDDDGAGAAADDTDDFFAELLGLDEEASGEEEENARRRRRHLREQKKRADQKAVQKTTRGGAQGGHDGFAAPYGSFRSSSSTSSSSSSYFTLVPELANVFLFPLRFFAAVLWGTGDVGGNLHVSGDVEPDGGFLSMLLPSRGLLGMLWNRGGGSLDLDPTRAGGFSLSASQLAAKQFLGGVVAELGPVVAGRHTTRRKPPSWKVSSLFSTTEHTVTTEFEGEDMDLEEDIDGDGDDDKKVHADEDDDSAFSSSSRPLPHRSTGAVTKFVYHWKAALPATHAVCLSVAPTEYTKYMRGGHPGEGGSSSSTSSDARPPPVFAVEVTERIAVDWKVLQVLGVFLLLGWIKKPLFARYSRVLQAVLAGVCGVVFLLLVAVYYLFRQFPRMKLWKTGLYVVLTVGGIAAVFDLLTHSLRYVVAELDATFVDWRLYAFATLACVGFVSSLLLRQMLSASVLGALTEHSYGVCRLGLLVWAVYTHPEAALATGIVWSVLQAGLWCFLMLLWLRYDPKLEEEKAILRQRERRRRSASLLHGRESGHGSGRASLSQKEMEEEKRYREIQSRHSGRRSSRLLYSTLNAQQLGSESLLSALHRRWVHRSVTYRHYTWNRVLVRFLRRCSVLMLSIVRHAVEDLDSEDDELARRSSSLYRPSSTRSSGTDVEPPDPSRGSSERRWTSDEQDPEPMPSPTHADTSSPDPDPRPRRSVSLPTVLLLPLVERWAAAQERWKHPQRYNHRTVSPPSAGKDPFYLSSQRHGRQTSPHPADEDSQEETDPRQAVLRKSKELLEWREKRKHQRWWPWGGAPSPSSRPRHIPATTWTPRGSAPGATMSEELEHLLMHDDVGEGDVDSTTALFEEGYYSSDSDLPSETDSEEDDEDDFHGSRRRRRRRHPRDIEAAFQRQLNDPLDVFPAEVYREARGPPAVFRSEKGSRSSVPVRDEVYRANVNEYTKNQLKQLATSIRARHDLSDLSRRLRSPNKVMRWARETAPTFEELIN